MNCNDVMNIIQTVCAIASAILAYFIPERIKWAQSYENLGSDYRSYDYAAAVQGIVEFYVVECKSDASKIRDMYEKRFLKEIYGAELSKKQKSNEEIFEDIKKRKSLNLSKEDYSMDNNKILHFQRRLLAQFFCDLDVCARHFFIGKRRVQKDYTSREADTIKILILIGEAISASPILMKELSCNEVIRLPEHYKGMNKYLSHIYSILKNAKRYMEV